MLTGQRLKTGPAHIVDPKPNGKAQSLSQIASERRFTKNAKAAKKIDSKIDLTSVPHRTKGEFHKWFNSLTPDEFDKVWSNEKLQTQIRQRLLFKGNHHEWLVRSRANVFKRWGLTVEDIASTRQPTQDINFRNPRGSHMSKVGSTQWHNELIELVDTSSDFDDYKRKLHDFANQRLVGGAGALPKKLKIQ